MTRRRFMTGVAHGAGGVAAAAFTLPALGFALAPVFKTTQMAWQPIGRPSDFPLPKPGQPTTFLPKVITITPGIGEAGKNLAYVRRRDPNIDTESEDQYNRFIAVSNRCAHLGCPVGWKAPAQRFVCPCHGGVYDLRGIVTGGPPVRPLDRFYTRLNPTTGLVEIGPRYSVNNELRRFSPRDPAEPLDGIGQYLYPARWSTPPLIK